MEIKINEFMNNYIGDSGKNSYKFVDNNYLGMLLVTATTDNTTDYLPLIDHKTMAELSSNSMENCIEYLYENYRNYDCFQDIIGDIYLNKCPDSSADLIAKFNNSVLKHHKESSNINKTTALKANDNIRISIHSCKTDEKGLPECVNIDELYYSNSIVKQYKDTKKLVVKDNKTTDIKNRNKGLQTLGMKMIEEIAIKHNLDQIVIEPVATDSVHVDQLRHIYTKYNFKMCDNNMMSKDVCEQDKDCLEM